MIIKWTYDHPNKKRTDEEFKNYKRCSNLVEDAKEMCTAIKISFETKIGILELTKIQNLPSLKGKYQINLYSTRLLGARVFKGPDATNQINLLIHGNHYYPIKSMPVLFNVDKFCNQCSTPLSKSTPHKCQKSTCNFCKLAHCKNEKLILNTIIV